MYQEPGLYPYPEEDIEWDEPATGSGCGMGVIWAMLACLALWLVAGILIARMLGLSL